MVGKNLIIITERLFACIQAKVLCSNPLCMAACLHYPQCFIHFFLFSSFLFLAEMYNPRLSYHLNNIFKYHKYTHCPYMLPSFALALTIPLKTQ